MKINRRTFFTRYRELHGSLDQSQVDGLEFLLGAIEEDPNWESIEQISYFLATVAHETAHTFQPLKEFRERKDSPRRANQDRYWLTGYMGRGFVQITWKKNYEKFGIADNPDAALEPHTAYRIASKGMREGLFTGLSLDDFINEDKTDYVNARKVVNGLDKANEIAKNAKNFEGILTVASEKDALLNEPENGIVTGDTPRETPEEKKPTVETVSSNPPVVEVKSTGVSWLTKISAAIAPVTTFFTGVGLKIGGVTVTRDVLIVFMVCLTVSFAIGAWVYNRGKDREQERLKWSMDNLATEGKGNVIAKGST